MPDFINFKNLIFLKLKTEMIRKSKFIEYSLAAVTSKYSVIDIIGEGNYGKVYRIINKENSETFACKIIEKSNILRPDRFRIEVELLKSTDHQNIVKLYEIFEDDLRIYLVLEECTGGELFKVLKERRLDKKFYTEREAAVLFKQIMSAIIYCHNKGIYHRDLKPENLLFYNKTQNILKLIDFGLSKYFKKSPKMKSMVGTICYMAPEIFTGNYTEKCDVWSAGVILYLTLSGKLPFFGKSQSEIRSKIIKIQYNFNAPIWSQISLQAQELLSKIFVNPENRLSSKELLEHDWIRELAPNSTEEILELEIEKVIEFTFLNKLQKSVVSFISYRFNFSQLISLNEIFKSFDKNADGEISIAEMKEGIKLLYNNNIIELDDEIEYLFKEIDLDKNGLINYNEFISAANDYKKQAKIEHFLEAFRVFDTDKNGKISLHELTDVIKPKDDDDLEYIKDLMLQYDLNGDGEIDINEFINCMGIDYENKE